MYPLWIATFFGAMLMMYTAMDTPRREAAVTRLEADVAATNFLAYRRSLQQYLEATPGATGTVADETLSSYWLHGYARDANWSNIIGDDTLYIYSTGAVVTDMLDALQRRAPDNLLLGRKNASTGRLQSHNGFDTGITLPTDIPDNAIVMMGR